MNVPRLGIAQPLIRLLRRLAVMVILIGAGLIAGLASPATAEEWPKDYQVYEESESPDHHYAILIPDHDLDPAPNPVYFADLSAHRVLGKIANAEYFHLKNHAALAMAWSEDSTWGVLELDGRWSFENVWVVELANGGFTLKDIGKEIAEVLDPALGKAAANDDELQVQLFPTVNPDRTLVMSGIVRTNARDFATRKTVRAYFHGSYNAQTKKWASATARKITEREFAVLDFAFSYQPGAAAQDAASSRDEKEGAQKLDDQLAQIYAALKFLLPSARFATLQKEQAQWLKKRAAAAPGAARMKMVGDRIDELARKVGAG